MDEIHESMNGMHACSESIHATRERIHVTLDWIHATRGRMRAHFERIRITAARSRASPCGVFFARPRAHLPPPRLDLGHHTWRLDIVAPKRTASSDAFRACGMIGNGYSSLRRLGTAEATPWCSPRRDPHVGIGRDMQFGWRSMTDRSH